MPCKPETLNPSPIKDAQFKQLIELSPIAAGIQLDGEIIFLNKTGINLFGAVNINQLLGKSLISFLSSTHHDTVKKQFQSLLIEEEPFLPLETKLISINGTTIDVELMAIRFTYNRKPAIQFSLYLITKRKKMEEMLFQAKHDWENTFHAITDIITIHDKEFNIVYANKAAQKILNLPSSYSENITKCFKFYHGTKCAPEGCPSCDCLKTGVPADFEIFEPHLNMYIEIRAMPRFDRDNQLIGLIHIARDITERKKTEEDIKKAKEELEMRVEERTSELKMTNEQLREKIGERKIAVELLRKSESKYRNLSKEFHTLLNCIPDNLLLLSPDLKIMWANKAAASAFNSNESELSGQYCYSLCCNVFSPCENCPTLKSFISGLEETAEIITAGGKIWDIRSFPIKDDSGKVKNVIELARDITEKTNLQAGAMRSRHLASLGELAAGVAHEINNPINNIINYAQIMIDELEPENEEIDIPMRIVRDGDRIATIVRSLLSFARIRKEEKSYVYLHDIFADTLSLTSAQIRKDGIHLKVHIPAKAIKVPVHAQQIQQVFLNIISNSRYALNQKYPGTHENKILEISCEKIMTASAPYVRIVFHDRGNGIPSNIIDKVINPFFSTKPNRIGTGLGLSISHGIINEHEGKLIINSIEGEYTKIMIDLPTTDIKDEE
ncbi:MAG: PAS domain-containing sensor histidine kinase [Nitrospiraceae bacterium]|nr:MAG: PAS domain-containing sensor histidine kinase [Nitrospiraceae bacterium]